MSGVPQEKFNWTRTNRYNRSCGSSSARLKNSAPSVGSYVTWLITRFSLAFAYERGLEKANWSGVVRIGQHYRPCSNILSTQALTSMDGERSIRVANSQSNHAVVVL